MKVLQRWCEAAGSVLVREHTKDLTSKAILDRARGSLSRFSAAYRCAGPPADYVQFGMTLVNEGQLAHQPALANELKARRGRTVRVRMPLSARVIYLSPRAARVLRFERAPNKTAKVVLSGVTRKGSVRTGRYSFRNEIRARRTASLFQTPLLMVPQLTEYSLGGRWLVEEMVEGRAIYPTEVSDFLVRAMVPFYRKSVNLRPIGRLRNAEKLINDLGEMVPELPLPSLNDQLPFILGHGDLMQSNILRCGDGYCLIDWEYAGVMPAAFDLSRLYQLSASLKGAIVEAITRLDSSPNSIPPVTQLALGTLDLTKELRSPGDEWQIRRMEKYGVTRDQAERQKMEFRQQARIFIRKLFGS